MKKVAIVILNWNGEQMLHRFLPSVLQHSENFADIVVADNRRQMHRLRFLRRSSLQYAPSCLTAIMALQKVIIGL